ncbi:hypothetical protein Tco_0151007 [Tanacetum coccineum]
MVQGRKSKDSVFTVNLYHDGLFICNPLRYVEGDVKQITDVNFYGMTFNDLREVVKCLVHGYENRMCVDLYVDHHDYDVLDFLLEETSDPDLISESSDEYCSDDESEDIDGVDFHTKGDHNVVI